MTDVLTYPETEGAMRTWLRERPAIAALVENRVFFGLPEKVKYPCLVVFLVSGRIERSGAPISRDLIQIDCWGEGRNKAQAAQLKQTVVNELCSMPEHEPLADGVIGLGATVEGVLWLPDGDSGQARYAVTAYVTATAATADP